jgi:hypothetical protein
MNTADATVIFFVLTLVGALLAIQAGMIPGH